MRQKQIDSFNDVIDVSIHAPVKDATACLWKALLITFSAYNFANNKVYK